MQSRILSRTRTRSTYFTSILSLSTSSQSTKKVVLNNFDKFCNEEYHTKDSEGIIEELRQTNDIDQSLDVLQCWINWNSKKIQSNAMRIYFHHINDYLYYRGIKLDRRDTKTLKFPKKIKRREYALILDDIQTIITPAKYSKKSLYLVLISSGMRINEVLRIKRENIDLECKRIKILIPASITKERQERITFLSSEASKYNIRHIKSLEPNDLVWGQNKNWHNNVITEGQNFSRLCKNVNLDMRYESGTRKITLHSFRSYFITKGNKIDDLGFGHAISGHDKYMKNYERYTDDELLELYLKLEPMLFVFDLTMQKEENDNLKIQLKEENEKLQNKIDEQNKRLRKLEELYIESNFHEVKKFNES